MKTILTVAVCLIIFGGIAWYAIALRTNTVPNTHTPIEITDASIREKLVGTHIFIPDGERKPSEIVLDEYPIDGEVLLGGAFVDTTQTIPININIVVPDFHKDTDEQTVLDVSGEDGAFVLAPLYVNFGGTGTFLMIALYEINQETGVLTHHAVHLIDDRVPFSGFEMTPEGTILVHYLTRSEGEAMVDAPTHPAVRTLKREGNVLVLID